MRTKSEILKSMEKTSLILSELVKGTSHEAELNILDSYSNEELIIKAAGKTTKYNKYGSKVGSYK